MSSLDKSKRLALNTFGAGALVVTSGGLLIPNKAHALDPVTILGLINALITLYSVNTQRDTALAQLKGSTEVARNQNYNDFNMQNSDPNKLMQTYSNGGALPLNCQGQVSKDSLLTVQGGVPYLHNSGSGNQEDSNVNRWEANEFERVAREETGVMPIPASKRIIASNSERDVLDKKGIDSDVWSASYIRNVKLAGKNQKIIVASNGSNKKTILV